MFGLSKFGTSQFCPLFWVRTLSLCSVTSGRNHYEVLGISRSASKKEIRAAFLRLSKEHHPDVSQNDGGDFIQISEAYSTLIDSEKRSFYDHKLNTIDAYVRNVGNSRYAGSHGYTTHQPWYVRTPWPTEGEYTNNNGKGFTNFEQSVWARERPNHGRVVKYLVLLMFLATCVHSFRIHWAHKEFQRASEEESRKNHLIYNKVRETAKSRTLEEQLSVLTKKHSEGLNKLSGRNI